jgi:hypothetical protein
VGSTASSEGIIGIRGGSFLEISHTWNSILSIHIQGATLSKLMILFIVRKESEITIKPWDSATHIKASVDKLMTKDCCVWQTKHLRGQKKEMFCSLFSDAHRSRDEKKFSSKKPDHQVLIIWSWNETSSSLLSMSIIFYQTRIMRASNGKHVLPNRARRIRKSWFAVRETTFSSSLQSSFSFIDHRFVFHSLKKRSRVIYEMWVGCNIGCDCEEELLRVWVK